MPPPATFATEKELMDAVNRWETRLSRIIEDNDEEGMNWRRDNGHGRSTVHRRAGSFTEPHVLTVVIRRLFLPGSTGAQSRTEKL